MVVCGNIRARKFNLESVGLIFSFEKISSLLKYTEINYLNIFVIWVMPIIKDDKSLVFYSHQK
jgi:hypothetical protein